MGTAQRFRALVLALIPYNVSAAFALVKTQSLVHIAVRVTRPNPSPQPTIEAVTRGKAAMASEQQACSGHSAASVA